MAKEKEKIKKEETEEVQEKEATKEKENPSSSDSNTTEQEEMVTIPLKSMEEQLKEIDDLKDKVKSYSDGWQRERADFDNYRKRIVRDRDQEKQNITVDILKKYLDIYDDLDLAMKNAPQSEEVKQWKDGIAMILKKMHKILETEGIEPVSTDMKFFDPQYHEAISHEDNPDFESGQIIEVVKKGYQIKNRVIRPALVRVAK
ncbi:MAG: nucleotide exchange factor GrpE [Chloroflexi bacterium]|jgi:molecular chaperone GrpE|nr:nucleotide exchange factor GrpE [Chloroflexota bacterium]